MALYAHNTPYSCARVENGRRLWKNVADPPSYWNQLQLDLPWWYAIGQVPHFALFGTAGDLYSTGYVWEETAAP